MICTRCKNSIEDDSIYCRFCGRKQKKEASPKKRGNGQGTVVKIGDKYRATVTIGYVTDDNGHLHRQTRSKTFDKKKDAVASLSTLKNAPVKKKAESVTFMKLYETWLPTHQASKSTIDCYKSAYKYFADIKNMLMSEIDIDDLQDCIDDCPKGKRTKENMKALVGLMYKYGIPRKVIPDNLNLAPYLVLERSSAQHRCGFTPEQINAIQSQIGHVFGAEYVYCLIYLGFRPSEFLSLTKANYDFGKAVIRGGSKTEAGTNRLVTISPKIEPYMKTMFTTANNILVIDENSKPYTLQHWTESVFYPVLDAANIDNPMEQSGDGLRHKYTPHSCRHTFATLLKNIDANSKDKLELIGHTSEDMLRYYQDVSIEDLKKITDKL